MLKRKIETFIKIFKAKFLILNRYEVIALLINKNNFKTFAEIGVYEGTTTKYLLKNCNLDRILCVDDYVNNNNSRTPREMEIARTKASELYEHDKVNFWEMSSFNASIEVKDEAFDMVFIDADHSYLGVKTDIQLWLPKVKKGGIICGHDYSIRWLGVIKAVTESFDNFHIDSSKIWWARK